MDTETHREGFTYTYSAKEQEELTKIRQKYLPPEENKMAQIRRLDASVPRTGTIASLAAGIAGALILGTGMCCCICLLYTSLRRFLSLVLWEDLFFP